MYVPHRLTHGISGLVSRPSLNTTQPETKFKITLQNRACEILLLLLPAH
jgi:hypothetical protein